MQLHIKTQKSQLLKKNEKNLTINQFVDFTDKELQKWMWNLKDDTYTKAEKLEIHDLFGARMLWKFHQKAKQILKENPV